MEFLDIKNTVSEMNIMGIIAMTSITYSYVDYLIFLHNNPMY